MASLRSLLLLALVSFPHIHAAPQLLPGLGAISTLLGDPAPTPTAPIPAPAPTPTQATKDNPKSSPTTLATTASPQKSQTTKAAPTSKTTQTSPTTTSSPTSDSSTTTSAATTQSSSSSATTSASQTSAIAQPQSTDTTDAKANSGSEGGLSNTAKLGIGIGVTVFVVLLVAGGAFEVFVKQQRTMRAKAAREQDPFKDPPTGQTDELDWLGHGGKKVLTFNEKGDAIPKVYQAYRVRG